MCCENPYNLGCYDSCQKVTIPNMSDKSANTLFARYNFNGAIRSELITEVDGGKPVINLALFNEDYNYTFEIVNIESGESLGCYQMKVEPCAGDFFEGDPEPITDYVDTLFQFKDYDCYGDTAQNIRITITDTTGIIDNSIINISFSSNLSLAGVVLESNDPYVEVVSNSKLKILNASLYNPVIELVLKIPECNDRSLNGVVSSLENLKPGWGNGTHTSDNKTITF